MKKGNRCTICTGCGRCFGEFDDPCDIIAVNDGNPVMGAPLFRPIICTDIGTTTVAMAYIDSEGRAADTYVCLNPQGRFGADVLSRIKASADKFALEEMKESIRNVIGTGVKKFIRENGLSGSVDMYVSANTTMTYLLMGYDPAELGEAPFTASHINGDFYEMKILSFMLEDVDNSYSPKEAAYKCIYSYDFKYWPQGRRGTGFRTNGCRAARFFFERQDDRWVLYGWKDMGVCDAPENESIL